MMRILIILLAFFFAITLTPSVSAMTAVSDNEVNRDFFYYFAYGSNLLKERIRYQQKGAEFVSIGRLAHFRLVFTGFSGRWQGAVASILESENDEVWGCVWRVPNAFAESLDKQEAGYRRLTVPIMTASGAVMKCRTYQLPDVTAFALPSRHYMHVIVSGAAEHRLPQAYIQKLAALPTNDFRARLDGIQLASLDQLYEQFGQEMKNGSQVD